MRDCIYKNLLGYTRRVHMVDLWTDKATIQCTAMCHPEKLGLVLARLIAGTGLLSPLNTAVPGTMASALNRKFLCEYRVDTTRK